MIDHSTRIAARETILSPFEAMPLDQVRAMQEGALAAQVGYLARNSPFYADKLAAAGAHPGDIRTLDDLAKLPLTSKQELRDSQAEEPPFGRHLAAPREAVVRVHASSGTTGAPSYVPVTAHDSALWQDAVMRSYWCQGMRPESTFAMGFSIGFFVGGIPLAQGVEAIGATLLPIGTGASERLIDSIRRMGADILGCTPSYAAFLAEYARDRLGVDVAGLGLKRLFLGAEPGGGIPEVRTRLQELWSAKVVESVGNADVFPMYAAECDAQDGCHLLLPDQLIMEIIDPETGAAKPLDRDAVEGEMVFTHLGREAVPLLRFRSHDRVTVRTTPCACGRTGPRVRIVGRTDDLMIVRGVNVWPSAIKDVVMSFHPETSGALRIVLPRAGTKVDPPVRIQVEHASSAVDTASLKARLETALRDRLIFTADVEIVPPGTLPRYEMKTKLVHIEPDEG